MARFFSQFLIAISLSVFLGMTFSGNESEPALENKSYIPSKYPDHIPGAFTGGFGEETCHTCHFSFDINEENGGLTVEGLNDSYRPGEQYEIVVRVESEDLGKGGFQMTARFEDGSQAGSFEPAGERLTFTYGMKEEIEYLQHSISGTRPTSDNRVSWSFVWEAPGESSEPVIFNIAANAANDDFSEFGDRIYVQEIIVGSGQ
ncbi:MAG: choice-of-anchor V domain-containing protein [Balneolaceae bacterium]